MSTPAMQQRIADWETQLKRDRDGLLATPGFCRLMWHELEVAGVFRSSFAGELTHSTAYNEGLRGGGLRLLALLTDANPAALTLLQAHAMPTTVKKDESDE